MLPWLINSGINVEFKEIDNNVFGNNMLIK